MITDTWVDLGDGLAIDASRVGSLEVHPPWPPSAIRMRAFLEQLSWTVYVLDSGTSVIRPIACYPAEVGARAHAHRIVDLMLTAADIRLEQR